MDILITGASSALGRAVAAELADGHKLRLFDSTSVDAGDNARSIEGELTDPKVVWEAVRGVDAILHLGEPPPALPTEGLARDEVLLAHPPRGTHVLFSAAVAARARRPERAGRGRCRPHLPPCAAAHAGRRSRARSRPRWPARR